MFDLQGEAKSLECTLKLCSIVRAHFRRVTKDLEHLLTHGVSYCLAAFIINQGQYAELTEAANCAKDVGFAVLITKVYDEVKGPFTAGSCGKRQELALPGAMRFATGKLALKASVRIPGTVGLHGGPVALGFK
jgi:hypothetical protein